MIYGIDMQLRQLDEDEEAAALFDSYLPGMRARAASVRESCSLSIRILARSAAKASRCLGGRASSICSPAA